LSDQIKESGSEEFHKNIIFEFFKNLLIKWHEPQSKLLNQKTVQATGIDFTSPAKPIRWRGFNLILVFLIFKYFSTSICFDAKRFSLGVDRLKIQAISTPFDLSDYI
jgi:hypothetical protein